MTEEAELKPEARIVTTKARSVSVDLDWPVEFDGQVYETITIRRVSGKQVEEFIAACADKGTTTVKAPMIDCPQEVYDAMDDDDRLRVEEAMLPFLPLRLQAVAASIPETAEDSSE